MDQRLKHIYDHLGEMALGLDDTFRFHCTMCGKCCINREDIMLSPKDMYNLAKELNMTALDVFNAYCETFIGSDSQFPIVRIKPQGSVKRCPLLKDRKCSVHRAKPTVCAMFPIGRILCVDKNNVDNLTVQDIRYILQKTGCGDNSEIHTVREWFKDFDLPLEDQFFIAWNQCVIGLSKIFRKLVKIPQLDMDLIWRSTMVILYLLYDIKQDFMPQFLSHAEGITKMMEEFMEDVEHGR